MWILMCNKELAWLEPSPFESRSGRRVSVEVLFYYQTNKRRASSFVQRQKY